MYTITSSHSEMAYGFVYDLFCRLAYDWLLNYQIVSVYILYFMQIQNAGPNASNFNKSWRLKVLRW